MTTGTFFALIFRTFPCYIYGNFKNYSPGIIPQYNSIIFPTPNSTVVACGFIMWIQTVCSDVCHILGTPDSSTWTSANCGCCCHWSCWRSCGNEGHSRLVICIPTTSYFTCARSTEEECSNNSQRCHKCNGIPSGNNTWRREWCAMFIYACTYSNREFSLHTYCCLSWISAGLT